MMPDRTKSSFQADIQVQAGIVSKCNMPVQMGYGDAAEVGSGCNTGQMSQV